MEIGDRKTTKSFSLKLKNIIKVETEAKRRDISDSLVVDELIDENFNEVEEDGTK